MSNKNYGFGSTALDAAFGAMVGDPAPAATAAPAVAPESTDTGDSSDSSGSDEGSSATLENILSGALADQAGDTESTDSSESTDSVPAETAKPSASQGTTEVEFVKSGDRKIKIDYANKEATKKAYLMAEGMRKFQAERDAERAEKASLAKELADMKSLWEKVEGVADSENYGEFIKIASKGKMDLETYLAKKSEKDKLRAEGTPEQIKNIELEEQLAEIRRELNLTKNDSTKKAEQAAKDKEAADIKNAQATVNPVFNKYRFAGKLGDADAEQRLDEMLWNTVVVNNLAKYDNVTPEIVDKEFKTISDQLNKVIKTQAAKEVKKTTEQRRVVAKTAAQVQQTKGVTDSSTKQDLVKHMRGHDLASVFRNWDQFGKMFK